MFIWNVHVWYMVYLVHLERGKKCQKNFQFKIKIQSDFLKWFYNILNYKYNKIF